MNPELATAIRALLIVAGGFMVDRQWLEAPELETVVAAILIIAGLTWAWWSKRPASKEAQKVAERVADSPAAPEIVRLEPNEAVTEMDPRGRRETDVAHK